MSWGVTTLADELPHFIQIKEFATEEQPKILTLITTPTYFHRFISYGLEISNLTNMSVPFVRWHLLTSKELFDILVVRLTLVSVIFLTLLYSSYLLHKENLKNTNLVLLSLIVIPIIFPFIPLIYTDTLAVSLILLAFVGGMRGKVYTSALSILLGTIVRQPTITWILPLIILIYSKERDVKKILPHLFVLGGFIIFTLLNKGIAVGDRNSHELGIHLQNMWFFGFIFFVTTVGYFYRSIIDGIHTYVTEHRDIVTRTLAVLSVLSVFAIYIHTYKITHVYNGLKYDWFLRNKLLAYTTSVPWAKVLFGTISISGLYMFLKTTYSNRYIYSQYIFKGIALVSISVMPLVEQRYYIPIFVLTAFYLSTSDTEFKVHKGVVIQTLCNIALGLYFFISMMNLKFFL